MRHDAKTTSASQRERHMAIYGFGISHHEAPVEVRERLAYTPERLTDSLRLAVTRRRAPESRVSELALLSTCNRTELYVVREDGTLEEARSQAITFLRDTLMVAPEVFSAYLAAWEGESLVRHLCRVAAGLESMVLGESEILGQVSEARRLAGETGAGGPMLAEVFRTAIRAGRRARSETAIGRNPASVSSVAVNLASQTVGDLAGLNVAVVGAGRMARKAITTLRAKRVAQITIVNRSTERARRLARPGDVLKGLNELAEVVAQADVVLCATSAPQSILQASQLEEHPRKSERSLVVLDIGTPRNVDPSVRNLEGVHLIDMGDINRSLQASLKQRRKEVRAVESIVEQEVAGFDAWLGGADILPVLSAIRQRAEADRQREVANLTDRMPDLNPEVRAQIESLSRSLVNTILDPPSRRLREEAGNGHAEEFARVARALFEVD